MALLKPIEQPSFEQRAELAARLHGPERRRMAPAFTKTTTAWKASRSRRFLKKEKLCWHSYGCPSAWCFHRFSVKPSSSVKMSTPRRPW